MHAPKVVDVLSRKYVGVATSLITSKLMLTREMERLELEVVCLSNVSAEIITK